MADDPERDLVVSYVPAAARAGLAALLALDDRLGALVRAGGDPMIATMRLTWWFEALERLDAAPPPAEPVLAAVARDVLPAGVSGAALAAMIDGWETLLGDVDLAVFARERGGRLFAAAAVVLGEHDARVAGAGEGWALADLARRWSDGEVASCAADMARARLAEGFGRRWPRALRPLGAMALLARSDLAGGVRGSPGRVGRLLVHRLTGR